jgi:hypothetical protein
MKTIEQIKDAIPVEVPIEFRKEIVTGTVVGRSLPFAKVILPGEFIIEFSWQAIQRVVNGETKFLLA